MITGAKTLSEKETAKAREDILTNRCGDFLNALAALRRSLTFFDPEGKGEAMLVLPHHTLKNIKQSAPMDEFLDPRTGDVEYDGFIKITEDVQY